LTAKAWASEGVKNCYQAFEYKNSSPSSTNRPLNQSHQLGKGRKQFWSGTWQTIRNTRKHI